ncbi:MAG TPA: metallophosphoesterase [Caulobacteraceae bacterium]|nr:metallophosphoesterase [Caulobacteraceae bacterium]
MTARIAHLSDIHFGTENAEAVAAAAALLADAPPDLTIITGDVTAFGEVTEFEAAAAWIAGLPGPRLVAPGNHDTPYVGLIDRVVAPFARFSRFFGPADAVGLEAPGVCVASVNTARGVQLRLNWSKGEIAETQASWAIRTLRAAAPGAIRILACHHPLAEMIGGPMTARVRGGERAARAFCAGGVDLVLTGHIHAPFAMAFPHADARTYAIGAGTLSVRERGAPAGFNLIVVEPDSVEVRALAWTGSRFDTWRTWNLERRPAAAIP